MCTHFLCHISALAEAAEEAAAIEVASGSDDTTEPSATDPTTNSATDSATSATSATAPDPASPIAPANEPTSASDQTISNAELIENCIPYDVGDDAPAEEAEVVSNADLLEDYVQSRIGNSLGEASPNQLVVMSARDQLTGLNLAIYEQLKARIKKIASGELSSTTFDIPFSDLGPSSFTAANLGVDTLVKDGQITAEAAAAYRRKMAYNMYEIRYALWLNCPSRSPPSPTGVPYTRAIRRFRCRVWPRVLSTTGRRKQALCWELATRL